MLPGAPPAGGYHLAAMVAREEIAPPSARQERSLLDGVLAALAGDEPVVDAAALAGDPPDARALTAALRERVGDGAVVACVGLLERLPDFLGVVETLVALAGERRATVVIAVPNHAFGADGARSAWGEGAVTELRQLLPAGHVVFHELALRGAALVPAGESAGLPLDAVIDLRAAAPAAFVLGFGPRSGALAPAATVAAAALGAERAHERARTAELEVLRARVRA
jgi:hypothetical protein